MILRKRKILLTTHDDGSCGQQKNLNDIRKFLNKHRNNLFGVLFAGFLACQNPTAPEPYIPPNPQNPIDTTVVDTIPIVKPDTTPEIKVELCDLANAVGCTAKQLQNTLAREAKKMNPTLVGEHAIFSERWLNLIDSEAGELGVEEMRRRFKKIVDNLDNVYDDYVELTGTEPEHGRQIFFDIGAISGYATSAEAKTDKNLVVYVDGFAKSSILDYMKQGRLDENGFVRSFAHEMGHIFDHDRAWKYDPESLADLKTFYTLEKNNYAIPRNYDWAPDLSGSGSRKQVLERCDIIGVAGIDKFFHEGAMTYSAYQMYNTSLVDEAGWDSFKATFRDFGNLPENLAKLPDEQRAVLFYDHVMEYGKVNKEEYFKTLPDSGKIYQSVKDKMVRAGISQAKLRAPKVGQKSEIDIDKSSAQ
jgi:hypothetical protein